MAQKVPHANDLPLSKGRELSNLLGELDTSCPRGKVDLPERQDRLTEIPELLRPNREAFRVCPRPGWLRLKTDGRPRRPRR